MPRTYIKSNRPFGQHQIQFTGQNILILVDQCEWKTQMRNHKKWGLTNKLLWSKPNDHNALQIDVILMPFKMKIVVYNKKYLYIASVFFLKTFNHLAVTIQVECAILDISWCDHIGLILPNHFPDHKIVRFDLDQLLCLIIFHCCPCTVGLKIYCTN